MIWEGYEMETGTFLEYEYGIVFPKEAAEGRPYIWRTEFFGAFPSADLAMLKKGYAVVYLRISDLYGCPEATALMEEFQPFVEQKYGLASGAILFGFSRGGLYALHYAAKRPERIASLYLDAPVVDIYSWPGGCYSGTGSPDEWEDCKRLWHLERDAFLKKVDAAIETLLTWSIPLILVAGGSDEVVPYGENGRRLQEAYEKSSVPFRFIYKPDCGHHPHSLEDPALIVEFLCRYRACPSVGNAWRINDSAVSEYPMPLIVHDRQHLELVTELETTFWGKYPLSYIGTSPWAGNFTNQKTMAYEEPQNVMLYDLLLAQKRVGWILYGLTAEENNCRALDSLIAQIMDLQRKCPGAKQLWLKKSSEKLPVVWKQALCKCGLQFVEYGSAAELRNWIAGLEEQVRRAPKPEWNDPLDREQAEWANLSITMPVEDAVRRILIVGDSISAGYGDMVQQRMPGFHVDRLNVSEGTHHPNLLRLLQIALVKYPYRVIHINIGIHVHGQTVEQYEQNLQAVLTWIHLISPQTKIVFATTTPFSKRLNDENGGAKGTSAEKEDGEHFYLGDRAPLSEAEVKSVWILDREASENIVRLNEAAKRLCAAMKIPVNDLYRLCEEENLSKSDGVHFEEGAYLRLAAQVAAAIRKEVKS